MNNDLSQLENELASWMPRRPSPGLRQRLFAEVAVPSPLRSARPAWPWLAPATCLFVFSLCLSTWVTPTVNTIASNASSNSDYLASLSLSGRVQTAYGSTEPSCGTWNSPPVAADLTRANHSLSINGSFPAVFTTLLRT